MTAIHRDKLKSAPAQAHRLNRDAFLKQALIMARATPARIDEIEAKLATGEYPEAGRYAQLIAMRTRQWNMSSPSHRGLQGLVPNPATEAEMGSLGATSPRCTAWRCARPAGTSSCSPTGSSAAVGGAASA